MSRSIRSLAFACVAVASVSAVPFSYAGSVVLAAPISDPDPMMKMTDANILAMLMTINDTEIGAANAAITEKKVEGDVKDYAQMLVKEHTKNNEKTKALSEKIKVTPEESDACKAMKMKDAEDLKQMKMLDGPAFAKAYIDMMVDGHTAALAKLNEAMGSTQNDDVKKHLEMTKEHVQHHLDKAKEIQAKLMK